MKETMQMIRTLFIGSTKKLGLRISIPNQMRSNDVCTLVLSTDSQILNQQPYTGHLRTKEQAKEIQKKGKIGHSMLQEQNSRQTHSIVIKLFDSGKYIRMEYINDRILPTLLTMLYNIKTSVLQSTSGSNHEERNICCG